MLEHKERVLLPFSFQIEEEYTIFENQFEQQFDNTQLKSCVDEKSIYEFSKGIECYEDHQTDHVFFDPIAEYMEDFHSPYFQLYLYYKDQIHFMLPWSFQYHAYFWFKCSQEVQMLDKINDWLHWNFHVS